MAVISAAMQYPVEVLSLCDEREVTAEWFHQSDFRSLFEALSQMRNEERPIDSTTLLRFTHDTGRLQACGGAARISEVAVFMPTAANTEYHLKDLLEKWRLREAIRVCNAVSGRAYREQDQAEDVIEQLEREALAIRSKGATVELPDLKSSVLGALGEIHEMYERRGQLLGLSTGLADLDEITGGLQAPNMYVIAGRPSMGKTALGMNIAEHIAIDQGKPVGVFSLEMSRQQLVQRLLTGRAKVNVQQVRKGFLTERDLNALSISASQMADGAIWIDDTASLTVQGLRGRARRMVKRYGIVALFIDYLQLLASSSKRAKENRQQEVTEISNGLKALAKELNIPVVVLAQLNRNPDSRTGNSKGRPKLSDLRESGAIEQDADFVGLLHRAEYYIEKDDEEALEKAKGKATLDVAKQRNGAVGQVKLTFIKEHTRFESRAHAQEGDED